MNYKILIRLLGAILTMLSAAMGICLLVAGGMALSGYDDHATQPLGLSFALTASFGILFLIAGRSSKSDPLLRKEAIALVSLGWIIAVVFGSLPFFFCAESSLTIPQCFFESMSGLTTTGSTVINDIEALPPPILLWRSLTQWIGGLGILALFVLLLSSHGTIGKSLVGAETSMSLGDSPIARVRDLFFQIWTVYVALTILCWLGLATIGAFTRIKMSVYEAFLYSLTTVSTGGFAPHNASVGHFESVSIEIFICAFMIISSLSMILIVNLVNRTRRRSGYTEAIVFLAMVAIAWLAVALQLWAADPSTGLHSLREAFFPVVCMASSGGFGTADYDQWPLPARVIIKMLMVIGGCSGSTAGGAKIIRFIILFYVIRQTIILTFRPKQVFTTRIDGRIIDSATQSRAIAFLALSTMIMLISVKVVATLEPNMHDLNTSFGAVFATFFNMGPGFGDVGPTDHFAHLQGSTLLFLSLLMLLGRLEIFVLLALFVPSFWKKY